MVSPMREKRTWPPQDKDSDGETVAAFEAAVAVVKETVVRSGEILVSAKEDLNDHQRWLKAQTAKIQADRQRHDRFLQRQRQRREALERREQKRERRRARRQAAARSINDAVSAAIFAVRSAVWLVVANTIAGLNFIDALAAYGLRWMWAWIRHLAFSVAGATWRGVSFAGRMARSLKDAVSAAIYAVRSAVWLVVAKTIAGQNFLDALAAYGLRWMWAWIRHLAFSVAGATWRGVSFAGRMARSLALSLAERIARAGQAAGHYARDGALRVQFGGIATRIRDVSRAAGRGLKSGLAGVSAQADVLTRSAGEALGPAMSAIAARAHALAPSLAERIARTGQAAGHYARDGALRVQSLLTRATSPAVEGENAVSSPQAVGRFDLSQMLIIAGALLLVCGGLMLGGGLMLRAKTPAPLVTTSASEPIAWLFEHPSLPLDERSVFVFDTTPDGLRIKGFAIGGVNLSEETLGALGGVIKPDRSDQDLDLALSVEKPEGDADGAPSAQLLAGQPEGTIPSEAPFRLVYLFPAEGADSGLTSQQVLSTYGGVLLKVHYEMGGKQRSFIQYLPTSLLEEQLSEILASAKGS